MENPKFRERVERLKQRLKGHWTALLEALLTNPNVVNRKNQPCPKCGGTDRFQYTDKFGDGGAYCRHCNHLDGFALLGVVNGWKFTQCVEACERWIGDTALLAVPQQPKNHEEVMQRLARRLWQQAQPIQCGDPVDRYLRARGLGMNVYPETLRTHASLGYYVKPAGAKKAKLVRNIPALLAMLQDETGNLVTIHRTYVEEGRKAKVPEPKKCLSTFNTGPAIRLFEPTDELALTEGIETALAIHLRLNKPVWATYSASNMEHVRIPDTVKRVWIYGDNDASFTGHAAAFALARRLMVTDKTREVQVFIPPKVDTDWADVWATLQERRFHSVAA